MRLADAVAARLRQHGLGARTFTLKVRDGGFTTITRATTLGGAVDTAQAIVEATAPLLDAVDRSGGVRLLGLAASRFAAPAEQLSLDLLAGSTAASADGRSLERRQPSRRRRQGALRRRRDRPGQQRRRGSGRAPAVRLVRAGAQQWGPDHGGSERRGGGKVHA